MQALLKMNVMKSVVLSFLYVGVFTLFVNAQSVELTKEYKSSTIDRLSEMLVDRYVFPDVAQKTALHLQKKLEAGAFDDTHSPEDFAKLLTEMVQEVNQDKHMRIRPIPPRRQVVESKRDLIGDKLYQVKSRREHTAGFKEAKKLEGNIGYFDLRGFAGIGSGAPVADHAMALLGTSDAIIIDLRKNGGGSPVMVQYLCSYFFDKTVHLNSLYWRDGDRTEEFWTTNVKGEKMPDVPLFVLTSNRTFSGAEEFSYNMQTQKRATLIGETTGGGANPGGTMPINEQLMVFIPSGRAINPITGTNWEGTGVVPDIEVKAEDALTEAMVHAQKAAEGYRMKKMDEYRQLLSSVETAITKHEEDRSLNVLLPSLEKCLKIGLLSEGDINQMGYDYMQSGELKKAEILLHSNTQLFPESANVFDSYGEVLAENGKWDKAIQNYKKAVELAELQDDPMLEMFQKNLMSIKKKNPN